MSRVASGRVRRFTPGVRLAFVVALAALAACDRGAPSRAAISPEVARPAPGPATPDVAPPSQPQKLEVVASARTTELTWTGSSDDLGVEGYEVLRDDAPLARVGTPLARDTEVQPGQRHCYSVVALDAAGHRSPASAPACAVTPDVSAPSVPAAVVAEVASAREALVRWTASSDDGGVTAYEILRDGRAVARSSEPSARVGALAPGQRHCFTVRALDGAGNASEPSGPACLEGPDASPPTTPQIASTEARAGQVAVRWQAAKDDVGVVAYEVVRDGRAVAKVGGTSFTDAGLHAAVRYCYGVVALDAAGNRSQASDASCATPPDVTPPSAPLDVTAAAEGETVVAVAWAASTDDVGVVRYEVLHEQPVASTTTSVRVTRLSAGREYCFRVRAYDAAGNGSRESKPACATTPDLTPPSVVTHVVARAESDRAVQVEWHAARDNVGVKEYELRRDGETVAITPADKTAILDQGLSPWTKYCYSVIATDAAGNSSAPSQLACVRTPDLVKPTVPPAVAVLPRSPTEITATWGRSSDDVAVAGYEILRDAKVIATFEAGTGLEAVIGSADAKADTCVTVRAFDAAGNRSDASAATCARGAEPLTPAAPWKVRAEPEPSEIVLSWQPSETPGIVYLIYRDAKRGSDRPIGTTTNRSFKVIGSAAQERHCYRVAARDDSSRESPRSFPVCAQLRRSVAAADRGEQN